MSERLSSEVQNAINIAFDKHQASVRLALETAINKVECSQLTGWATGTLALTPDNVTRTKGNMTSSNPCEVEAKIVDNSVKLFSPFEICGGMAKGSEVRFATIKFPHECCVCMEEASHFELAEVGVPNTVDTKGRIQFSSEKAMHAVLHIRIWLAVPFCSQHTIIDNTEIDFQPTKLCFANEEYARRVAQLNGWSYLKVTSLVKLKRLLVGCGLGLIFLAVILLGATIYFSNQPGQSVGALPTFAALSFVIGVVLQSANLIRETRINPAQES